MELNKDTTFILGRPIFWCGSVARRLRELGHDIEKRAEEEQAYVINFMLELYDAHGSDWGEKFDEAIKGS